MRINDRVLERLRGCSTPGSVKRILGDENWERDLIGSHGERWFCALEDSDEKTGIKAFCIVVSNGQSVDLPKTALDGYSTAEVVVTNAEVRIFAGSNLIGSIHADPPKPTPVGGITINITDGFALLALR